MKYLIIFICTTFFTVQLPRSYDQERSAQRQQKHKNFIARTKKTFNNYVHFLAETTKLRNKLINSHGHLNRHDMRMFTDTLEQIIQQIELIDHDPSIIAFRIRIIELKHLIAIGKGRSLAKRILWKIMNDIHDEVQWRRDQAAREYNAAINYIPFKQLRIYRMKSY